MENKKFFHLCGDGPQSRNFITCHDDFCAAFNLVGVCAANTDVNVVSFSIEESHGHHLLWGTMEVCTTYKLKYESQYKHYAAATRPKGQELVFDWELYPIDDENYLKNVATYTIIQSTKDGKPVMFYDYRWGTGSMYFRDKNHIPLWYYDENGILMEPVPFGKIGAREQRLIVHSKTLTIPDNWLVCNDLILPSNYIDPQMLEDIYRTHNSFRVFMSSPKAREEEMLRKMADYRGVGVDDIQARQLCGDMCKSIFGTRDPRRLTTTQRVALAQQLRRQFRMSFRQLAMLVRLSEKELRVYVRT
ncbi:MAG: hypothetical protein J5748_02120 [Bacteroidales bacterium]|nr:hypothetical protein [Bacteroidales bacterium]